MNMTISEFFNKTLSGKVWRTTRKISYGIRHRYNALHLSDGERYFRLEEKTDRIPTDKAIDLMKAHFSSVENYLGNKGMLKVGFCVYSSSEWQCERIYRYLEKAY